MSDLDSIFDRDATELTVAGFHSALRTGEATAAGLVDRYLARIDAHDRAGAGIGSVVTVNPEARAHAAALDESFAATGRLAGPLHGVPVLVKDQAETAGIRTTFGCVAFENHVPARDAAVVRKLKAAGAIVLAKTSMCDLAAGWFSSSSMTGHTRNPYAPDRESGGSSAGTGAGVAANFGLVGIGEDTGGSIRIPASFTNLFGLRVTTGLISRAGFSPLVHFQDTPGPVGRTVADVATLLDAIVGYDPADPFTVAAWTPPAAGGYAEAVATDVPLSAWRVGVLETAFGPASDPDAKPVSHVVRSAVALLGELGAGMVPDLEIDRLDGWVSDTSVYLKQSRADIDRFLAARPDAPVATFMDIYTSGRFHPENDLFHGIAGGPDSVDRDAEYLWLRLNQEHFRRLVLNVFAENRLDLLVYPTVRVVPPTHAELAEQKYTALTFPTNTVIASQAGLPALTVPVGFTADGLPVGMEVVGPPFAEARLLQFARAWEQATNPRRAPAL